MYVLEFVGHRHSGPVETENNSYLGKFYSGSAGWQGVEREQASKLTHRDALTTQGKLHRIGLFTTMKPA